MKITLPRVHNAQRIRDYPAWHVLQRAVAIESQTCLESQTGLLLTSVFEIKRTGLNEAAGAIDCMLKETIERFGVIVATGRVVDVVVREGEPLLFFRGAYR
jgi:hypothetical protein